MVVADHLVLRGVRDFQVGKCALFDERPDEGHGTAEWVSVGDEKSFNFITVVIEITDKWHKVEPFLR